MKTFLAVACITLAVANGPALAQNVKVTPVGSHPGELCSMDRATIFEDPTGVRILYDTGHTVTGGDDERLGAIHVVLVTHAHGDHIGDQKLKAVGAGDCANPERVSAAPNSTTAEVAAAKKAAIVTNNEMTAFLARKVQNIGGKPVGLCEMGGGAAVVPLKEPCRSNVHLGGAFTAKTAQAAQGVEITVVYASHANNVSLSLLSEAQRSILAPDDTGVALGPPIGYVVKFSNGLVVYLSGDTGINSEMKTVVNEYHHASLAMLNFGATAVTTMSAAYAMNELVRPASVIVSHVGEAATQGGKLRENSRTAALVKQFKATPYLAISGRTMEFDGKGKCVAGC